MKKLFMMLGFAFLTVVGYGQMSEKESSRQWSKYNCRDSDMTLAQCKERFRREQAAEQRRKDSIDRELKAEHDAGERSIWEAKKERRNKLTPEERAKEDERTERVRQEREQEKKVDKTSGFGAMFWLGLNFPVLPGTPPANTPAPGFKFGVHTHVFNLSDYVGLGVGAEYSMQGGKYKSSSEYTYIPGGNYSSSSTSATRRLNYLNFPILVHYQKQRHGFFAEAGVQPGVLLSAKNKGTNTTDLKKDVKKFDVGIPIGAGYLFKNKFGVGLHITPGLINVNKNEQYKNRNMVASVSASYSL